MELLTRKDALSQGLTHYFSGKPCKRGHVAKRRVDNWTCVECQDTHDRKYKEGHRDVLVARSSAYYFDHVEEKAAYNRTYLLQYRADNKEKLAQQKAAAYAANREEEQAKRREYYAANREQRRSVGRQYYLEHKELFNASAAARRARLAGDRTLLTKEERDQINSIYANARRLNRDAGYIAYHVDHIIPLVRGGKHHPANLQILTAEENLRKGAKLAA